MGWPSEPAASPATRDVFVVHGRADGPKQAVARFLTKLELRPIILHEQPSQGRTIIEKFEAHTTVAFAIVLVTPDDEGRHRGEPELSPRARQNVIWEWGYLVAKLGRERVCALYSSGTELPSDLNGVAWVEMDAAGAWQLEVARELRAVNVAVDTNEL